MEKTTSTNTQDQHVETEEFDLEEEVTQELLALVKEHIENETSAMGDFYPSSIIAQEVIFRTYDDIKESGKMSVKEFEKYLIAEGGYYYRPNITVHYSEEEKTGKSCFWGNYNGEETEAFESLQALMDAHSWIPIPDRKAAESFPMAKKLPKLIKHEINCSGISIQIVHKPN